MPTELMPVVWTVLLLCLSLALALLFVRVTGSVTHVLLKKVSVAALYLNPWFWGDSLGWNEAPSKRETVLIAWAIIFLISGVIAFIVAH